MFRTEDLVEESGGKGVYALFKHHIQSATNFRPAAA